jgi:hypothetical protein
MITEDIKETLANHRASPFALGLSISSRNKSIADYFFPTTKTKREIFLMRLPYFFFAFF